MKNVLPTNANIVQEVSGFEWSWNHIFKMFMKCNEWGQKMCNTFILKRHRAKVHGVMPTNVHQCKHCPMFFSGKGSLKNHLT